MSRAQSREHMDMIGRAANSVRDALHPANGSADVFMNTVTKFWSHPRFAVLGAEDKMVVEGKMRRSHEARFSRSCRSAIHLPATDRWLRSCLAAPPANLSQAFGLKWLHCPRARIPYATKARRLDRRNAARSSPRYEAGGFVMPALRGSCASWRAMGRHEPIFHPRFPSRGFTPYRAAGRRALRPRMRGRAVHQAWRRAVRGGRRESRGARR